MRKGIMRSVAVTLLAMITILAVSLATATTLEDEYAQYPDPFLEARIYPATVYPDQPNGEFSMGDGARCAPRSRITLAYQVTQDCVVTIASKDARGNILYLRSNSETSAKAEHFIDTYASPVQGMQEFYIIAYPKKDRDHVSSLSAQGIFLNWYINGDKKLPASWSMDKTFVTVGTQPVVTPKVYRISVYAKNDAIKDPNLRISLNNWLPAKVYIDGEEIGSAPILYKRIRPGTHEITVMYPGYYTYKRTLVVQEPKVYYLSPYLIPFPVNEGGFAP